MGNLHPLAGFGSDRADLAKVGQLVLDQGSWNTNISTTWLEESIEPRVAIAAGLYKDVQDASDVVLYDILN